MGRIQQIETIQAAVVLENESLRERVEVLERTKQGSGYASSDVDSSEASSEVSSETSGDGGTTFTFLRDRKNVDTFLREGEADTADEEKKFKQMQEEASQLGRQDSFALRTGSKSSPHSELAFAHALLRPGSRGEMLGTPLGRPRPARRGSAASFGRSSLSMLQSSIAEEEPEEPSRSASSQSSDGYADQDFFDEDVEADEVVEDDDDDEISEDMPFAQGGWFTPKEMRNLLRHGSISDIHAIASTKNKAAKLASRARAKSAEREQESISSQETVRGPTVGEHSASTEGQEARMDNIIENVNQDGEDGKDNDDDDENDDDEKWRIMMEEEEAATAAAIAAADDQDEEAPPENAVASTDSGKLLGGRRLSSYLRFAAGSPEQNSGSDDDSDDNDGNNDCRDKSPPVSPTKVEGGLLGGRRVSSYLRFAAGAPLKSDVDGDDSDSTVDEDDADAAPIDGSDDEQSPPFELSLEIPNDENLLDLDFDVRQVVSMVGSRSVLSFVAERICSRLNLLDSKPERIATFSSFIGAVEMSYDSSNAYHNSIHAADVALTAASFLEHTGITQQVESSESTWRDSRLALLVAAAVHDVGHPARMNPFMVATKQPLTLPYTDTAGVLEAMHAARFLDILRQPGSNVFEHLDEMAANRTRETVVDLVLATDLTKQGDIMAQWNAKKSSSSSSSSSSSTAAAEDVPGWNLDLSAGSGDRTLFLKMVIKAADVSNPAKALPLYLFWTNRILEEFYDQGDEERRMGIPVTSMPQCDRHKPAVVGGQKGFIAFVVKPTFEALAGFSAAVLAAPGVVGRSEVRSVAPRGLQSTLDNIASNVAFWKEVEDNVSAETLATTCFPSDIDAKGILPEGFGDVRINLGSNTAIKVPSNAEILALDFDIRKLSSVFLAISCF